MVSKVYFFGRYLRDRFEFSFSFFGDGKYKNGIFGWYWYSKISSIHLFFPLYRDNSKTGERLQFLCLHIFTFGQLYNKNEGIDRIYRDYFQPICAKNGTFRILIQRYGRWSSEEQHTCKNCTVVILVKIPALTIIIQYPITWHSKNSIWISHELWRTVFLLLKSIESNHTDRMHPAIRTVTTSKHIWPVKDENRIKSAPRIHVNGIPTQRTQRAVPCRRRAPL